MTENESQEQVRTERLAQLGNWLAGFAHEIRNPLSTIGLNLQLVKEDFAEAETIRGKRTFKRLEVVEGEVKRLQAILAEFLRFARHPNLERRPTDLNALLRSVVEFMVPEMNAREVSLRFYPGAAVGTVELDGDQIRAAVVNLLRNALDACKPGDEVMVSTGRQADRVAVRVTDTGAGMGPEVQAKAFDPYFSTKKQGTGLGLPTTRRIARDHGGSLEVSSDPGRGTQFTMELPVKAEIPGAPESTPERRVDEGGQ
jgi:signal transduction histidine kinase